MTQYCQPVLCDRYICKERGYSFTENKEVTSDQDLMPRPPCAALISVQQDPNGAVSISSQVCAPFVYFLASGMGKGFPDEGWVTGITIGCRWITNVLLNLCRCGWLEKVKQMDPVRFEYHLWFNRRKINSKVGCELEWPASTGAARWLLKPHQEVGLAQRAAAHLQIIACLSCFKKLLRKESEVFSTATHKLLPILIWSCKTGTMKKDHKIEIPDWWPIASLHPSLLK